MFFNGTLTVPAGTAASSPAELEIDVDKGVIHRVAVTFLDGPENTVNAALRSSGGHQIYPTNSGSVVGNNRTVHGDLRYSLEEPPYKVVLQGWSPNAAYAHDVTVDIHILPREALEGSPEGIGILRRLARAILGGA